MRHFKFIVFHSIYALAFSLVLSACHFGNTAEEMFHKYNDVERDITYVMDIAAPGGGTRVELTDYGLEGINSRWTEDNLGLFDFGEVFCVDVESGESPDAICLEQEEESDETQGGIRLDIDYAPFKGKARSKIGTGFGNKEPFSVVYPYKICAGASCASTEILLNYDGQVGDLKVIADNFLYAWGYCQGVCADATVTIKENMATNMCNQQEWHTHSPGGSVILDNKMALMRWSFVINDGEIVSLSSYLQKSNLFLSSMTIENMGGSYYTDGLDTIKASFRPQNFTQGVLNLKTGIVAESGNKYMSMSPSMIEVTPESEMAVTSGGITVWGSTMYLAVPCPAEDKPRTIIFHPYITVRTLKQDGSAGPNYYGSLEAKRLYEGDYYISNKIELHSDKTMVNDRASLFLYHNSSFIWDNISLE